MLRGPHSATKPYVVSVLVLSVRHALKRKQKENIIVSNCKYQRGGTGCQERREKSTLVRTAKSKGWTREDENRQVGCCPNGKR